MATRLWRNAPACSTRLSQEEGITAILPGERAVNWRCDPIPLPLSAAEFAALEAGLAQRARLMELILADLYGPQTLLAEGLIPPDLVYGNPGLPASLPHRRGPPARPLPVRSTRPTCCAGPTAPGASWPIAPVRRRASPTRWKTAASWAASCPSCSSTQKIQQLRPFLEITSEALQALAPDDDAGVALLSGGHDDPMWFEHVLLSRELSINLVESGDLTLRNGQVFLKTLRGLQRIGVLFRRKEGNRVDSLELAAGSGVPGLLEAIRGGLGPHGQRPRLRPGRGARASPRSCRNWPAACSARICSWPARPRCGSARAPWSEPCCAIWKAG